jgi:phosphoenolpyruvate carboxykinase (GTP)
MTATSERPQTAPTTHRGILDWVEEITELTTPDRVHWCTGSDAEWTQLTDALVASGTFTRLDETKKPNSFHAASDPTDVARVEDRTFICSVDEKDAGPTNNWMDPREMKALMTELYRGCMRGRTMYVIPFVMGTWSPSTRCSVWRSPTPPTSWRR